MRLLNTRMGAAKRSNLATGYGEKLTVRVLTVDKERNRIECSTSDGASIYAAVWETSTVFRWPLVGEIWTVRKDTGVWRIDQQVQTNLAEEISESTPISLIDLPEGDTRINGNSIHLNSIQLSQRIKVSGSKEDGTAFANLLKVLEEIGLIIDETV